MDKQIKIDNLQAEFEDLMVLALPKVRMNKKLDKKTLDNMVSILKKLETNLTDEVFIRKSLCFSFLTLLNSLYAEEDHAKNPEEVIYIIGTIEEQIFRVLSK